MTHKLVGLLEGGFLHMEAIGGDAGEGAVVEDHLDMGRVSEMGFLLSG